MVGIINYGVGNLFSLKSSLAYIGEEAVVTNDPAVLQKCDHIILPGVGAFGDAAEKLRQSGMAEVVLKEAAAGKPLLGICLGMQLLFEKSYEYGEYAGLGLIPGVVRPIAPMIRRRAESASHRMEWTAFSKRERKIPHFCGLSRK